MRTWHCRNGCLFIIADPYNVRTRPRSWWFCCRREQKYGFRQTLAGRPRWWCNCKPWWHAIEPCGLLEQDNRDVCIYMEYWLWKQICKGKHLSNMESLQRPLTVTLLTGAGTSQRPQYDFTQLSSLMLGFVIVDRVVPESSRFTWNYLEQYVIISF